MRLRTMIATAATGLIASPALAQPTIAADSGDSSWILTASALVLMMTIPGLALFYGGLVRAKNVLSILMHCFIITCTVSLIWAVFGYSLVFGEGNLWIGGIGNLGLTNLAEIRAGTTLPESVYALFQMTFAIITPALVIGAFVERVRFGWVVAFSILWSILVYIPVARWVWGGGWLAERGTLDFAGGIVVHTTAGIAALVVAIMLGARKGFNKSLLSPHSPTLTMTGAGLLWVGWFGFNGGSALAAGDAAAAAIINTHLAACAAAIMWLIVERAKIGKATSIGIVTGAVAGLATVTPAAGYIGPMGAILLGAAAGLVCFYMVLVIKQKFQIDDSLDVFAVHGVGGMLGSIAFPFLVLTELGGPGYENGKDMLGQLFAQVFAVGVVAIFTGVVTWLIAFMISYAIPMRVDEEAEHDGLDLTSHGERGWEFD
jgi:Amt family ammonium transporter